MFLQFYVEIFLFCFCCCNCCCYYQIWKWPFNAFNSNLPYINYSNCSSRWNNSHFNTWFDLCIPTCVLNPCLITLVRHCLRFEHWSGGPPTHWVSSVPLCTYHFFLGWGAYTGFRQKIIPDRREFDKLMESGSLIIEFGRLLHPEIGRASCRERVYGPV